MFYYLTMCLLTCAHEYGREGRTGGFWTLLGFGLTWPCYWIYAAPDPAYGIFSRDDDTWSGTITSGCRFACFLIALMEWTIGPMLLIERA